MTFISSKIINFLSILQYYICQIIITTSAIEEYILSCQMLCQLNWL